jgi:hypothetical protein
LLNYDGRLFISPIDQKKQIHSVLDVGTGTGIWAIDFGDEFPESKVQLQLPPHFKADNVRCWVLISAHLKPIYI